jgi:hypothetical protein
MASIFNSLRGKREPIPVDTTTTPPSVPIRPGYYGDFANRITVYDGGETDDKLSNQIYLCGNGRQPSQICIGPKGRSDHILSLFSAAYFTDEPMAVVRHEKSSRRPSLRWKLHTEIELPAPRGAEGDTKVEKMVDQGSLRKNKYSFEVLTGESGPRIEKFEWRRAEVYKDPEVFFLHRMAAREEVVLEYRGEPLPYYDGFLGTFTFKGDGAGYDLGEYWRSMAVVTGLTILRMDNA